MFDNEFPPFQDDLVELESEPEEWVDSGNVLIILALKLRMRSDEPLRGPIQELNFGSDDDDEEVQQFPSKIRKSKQFQRPEKIIPTTSDATDSSDSDEEDGRITMANMEARSRALDEAAAAEAELDAEELRRVALEANIEDVDMDDDASEVDENFSLPTAAEREEEKAQGGPDVHTVQQRMKHCVRVLGNFKKHAEKGR